MIIWRFLFFTAKEILNRSLGYANYLNCFWVCIMYIIIVLLMHRHLSLLSSLLWMINPFSYNWNDIDSSSAAVTCYHLVALSVIPFYYKSLKIPILGGSMKSDFENEFDDNKAVFKRHYSAGNCYREEMYS